MNQNELYKTLAVDIPRPEIVETPKPEVAVVKPQKSITDEEAGFELDNLGTSLLERFEKLSLGQQTLALSYVASSQNNNSDEFSPSAVEHVSQE